MTKEVEFPAGESTDNPAESKDDILEEMRSERVRTELQISQLMEEAGKGLFQSQVKLKQAPWKVVWLKQDLMIERQETVIDLLAKINKNLEKLLESETYKK